MFKRRFIGWKISVEIKNSAHIARIVRLEFLTTGWIMAYYRDGQTASKI